MRITRFLAKFLALTISAIMVCCAATTSAGTLTYQVAIDTSIFSGQAGDIEIQLASSGDNIPVTASFSAYASDAVLNGLTYNYAPGNPNATVTGDLSANSLSLYNDDSAFQTADADQLVSLFGTSLAFVVTLTGDGIGTSSASAPTLGISLFNASNSPLFSGPASQNYSAVFFQMSTDGTVAQTNYPAATVPEPSSLVGLSIGLLGLAWNQRRLNRSPARNTREFRCRIRV